MQARSPIFNGHTLFNMNARQLSKTHVYCRPAADEQEEHAMHLANPDAIGGKDRLIQQQEKLGSILLYLLPSLTIGQIQGLSIQPEGENPLDDQQISLLEKQNLEWIFNEAVNIDERMNKFLQGHSSSEADIKICYEEILGALNAMLQDASPQNRDAFFDSINKLANQTYTGISKEAKKQMLHWNVMCYAIGTALLQLACFVILFNFFPAAILMTDLSLAQALTHMALVGYSFWQHDKYGKDQSLTVEKVNELNKWNSVISIGSLIVQASLFAAIALYCSQAPLVLGISFTQLILNSLLSYTISSEHKNCIKSQPLFAGKLHNIFQKVSRPETQQALRLAMPAPALGG